MALADLAQRSTDQEHNIRLSEIAERQDISLLYLEQIFAKLKRQGIVESARGPSGGYRLAKSASQISIAEILYAADEPIKMTRCSSEQHCTKTDSVCDMHHLWATLEQRIHNQLHTINLSEIVHNRYRTVKALGTSVYLDYNASAPLRPQVRAALSEAHSLVGNPSSVHQFGRRTRQLVEIARTRVATLLEVKPAQIIFTSGGTEANTQAIRGPWDSGKVTAVLMSALEHDSVTRAVPPGMLGHTIPATRAGTIDIDILEKMLQQNRYPCLVSVMHAHNETGVIQPIQDIAKLVHAYGGWLHCDAVQTFGRLPFTFDELGADLISVSAHKLGGPKGVGALIVRDNLAIDAVLKGGGQEHGRRAGTQNVEGIIGFGVAAVDAIQDDQHQISQWRDQIETSLRKICPDLEIFGLESVRLANTTCLTMPGVLNETQVMAFDLEGYAVSAGAACSSGKVQASQALMAMGVAEHTAKTAIRVSLGWQTTEADVTGFIDTWQKIYARHQQIAS